MAKGDIILAQSMKVAKPNTTTLELTIPISDRMAPKARLLIYYVRKGNSEIVADAINFNVGGAFKTPVGLSSNVTETQPGGQVDIRVYCCSRPEMILPRKMLCKNWNPTMAETRINHFVDGIVVQFIVPQAQLLVKSLTIRELLFSLMECFKVVLVSLFDGVIFCVILLIVFFFAFVFIEPIIFKRKYKGLKKSTVFLPNIVRILI